MIQNKEMLKEYIREDLKQSLGESGTHPSLVSGRRLTKKWLICLRKCEYYKNTHVKKWNPIYIFYRLRFNSLSVKLGYEIPFNATGKGLRLLHRGPIVINDKCKLGNYCTIHSGVNLGEKNQKAPQVGDYVYLSPGVKLIGDVYIGNHNIVGANAVVTHSFPEEGISIAGIPAKKISDHGWMTKE